ncbi:mitochondrial carrier domain-containing protein [Scheffersomyces coipomensis]|uniref:mitochondrial carrier domain-containing protein n=1 Tax=Scheffersomyces coipomensis TaxID=1788519 RepID=UPI00315CB600
MTEPSTTVASPASDSSSTTTLTTNLSSIPRRYITDPRQIDIIAGLSAGFMTTVIGHPLDLIKIRLQLSHLNPTPSSSKKVRFDSIIQVIQKIKQDSILDWELFKHKGGILNRYYPTHVIKQFYRGIVPNLIGNVSAWSLYFTLYSEFKTILGSNQSSIYYFTASSMAGISTSIITNPIWVLKTRFLSSSSNELESYKSLSDGVRTMLRNEGIFSFWKGLIPSLASIFQASIQFTIYDNLKSYVNNDKKHKLNDQLTTIQYIYCSGISKIFSMIIMYPTQVLRSRLQIIKGDAKASIFDVAKDLYVNEGGLKGFYKGLSANIVRVVPATCVTFVVYESVKNYLS